MVNLKLSRTVAMVAFTVFLWPGVRCLPQSAPAHPCDSSTVDDLDPAMAKRAKAFLAALKAFVASGNKRRVAAVISYPLNVFDGNSKKIIHNPAEFIANYARLVTSDVKKSVLAQSPDCLFANYQGVMIGDGAIWFEEQSNGSFRIITINLGKATKPRTGKHPANASRSAPKKHGLTLLNPGPSLTTALLSAPHIRSKG